MRRPRRETVLEGRMLNFWPFWWRRCDRCGCEFRRESGGRRVVYHNWAGEDWEFYCSQCKCAIMVSKFAEQSHV